MPAIKIESYSDRYKKEVPELIVHIQKNEFGLPIGLEGQPDLKDIPGFYQKNGGNFWVAINEEGRVVGMIALLDIGNACGALRKMFVHAEFRGKTWQVGQSLLKTLLDWAAKKSLAKIYLGTTEKFVAAHRFYEKNGFVAIDKKLLPPDFPVMSVDVKFYSYSLADKPGLTIP